MLDRRGAAGAAGRAGVRRGRAAAGAARAGAGAGGRRRPAPGFGRGTRPLAAPPRHAAGGHAGRGRADGAQGQPDPPRRLLQRADRHGAVPGGFGDLRSARLRGLRPGARRVACHRYVLRRRRVRGGHPRRQRGRDEAPEDRRHGLVPLPGRPPRLEQPVQRPRALLDESGRGGGHAAAAPRRRRRGHDRHPAGHQRRPHRQREPAHPRRADAPRHRPRVLGSRVRAGRGRLPPQVGGRRGRVAPERRGATRRQGGHAARRGGGQSRPRASARQPHPGGGTARRGPGSVARPRDALRHTGGAGQRDVRGRRRRRRQHRRRANAGQPAALHRHGAGEPARDPGGRGVLSATATSRSSPRPTP